MGSIVDFFTRRYREGMADQIEQPHGPGSLDTGEMLRQQQDRDGARAASMGDRVPRGHYDDEAPMDEHIEHPHQPDSLPTGPMTAEQRRRDQAARHFEAAYGYHSGKLSAEEAQRVLDGACHDESDEYDSRRGVPAPGEWHDDSAPSFQDSPDEHTAADMRDRMMDEMQDEDEDEEEAEEEIAGRHVKVQCRCGGSARVRLPSHLRVVEGEGESRILRTRCASCGETVRFVAPEGHRFVKMGESSVVRHFFAQYRGKGPRSGGGALRTFFEALRDGRRR